MIPERHISLRIVRKGAEECRADRTFWEAVPPEERLLCLWDMVLELESWKGDDGGQPGLQRSVIRVCRA